MPRSTYNTIMEPHKMSLETFKALGYSLNYWYLSTLFKIIKLNTSLEDYLILLNQLLGETNSTYFC